MFQSSNFGNDPLTDVLEVLGARVTRRTRLEAGGQWSLSFPDLERLKFVAVMNGSVWMCLPGQAPLWMQAGDVCLIGRTTYVVTSDPALPPLDGQRFFGVNDDVHLGGDEVVALGGSVAFKDDAAQFLLNMLPDFMIVRAGDAGSDVISTILRLMSDEVERQQMGHRIVSSRLADVLLVEAIRAYAKLTEPAGPGWLGALIDPRIGRTLAALHADIAQPWTIARLADVAGMSRAAFAAEFTHRLGRPPMSYLRSWRLTVAHAALSQKDAASVADIAFSVGYCSQSAFSQAFRRAYGITPKNTVRP